MKKSVLFLLLIMFASFVFACVVYNKNHANKQHQTSHQDATIDLFSKYSLN